MQDLYTTTVTLLFALSMFGGFVGGFKSGINAS